MVTALLPASDVMLEQIVQETAKDLMLQKVVRHIHNGWSKGSYPQFYPVSCECGKGPRAETELDRDT